MNRPTSTRRHLFAASILTIAATTAGAVAVISTAQQLLIEDKDTDIVPTHAQFQAQMKRFSGFLASLGLQTRALQDDLDAITRDGKTDIDDITTYIDRLVTYGIIPSDSPVITLMKSDMPLQSTAKMIFDMVDDVARSYAEIDILFQQHPKTEAELKNRFAQVSAWQTLQFDPVVTIINQLTLVMMEIESVEETDTSLFKAVSSTLKKTVTTTTVAEPIPA